MSPEAVDPNPQGPQVQPSDAAAAGSESPAASATSSGVAADASMADSTEASDDPSDPKYLDRYECDSCGYIYEPVKGDGAKFSGGTAFKEIPTSWRCPVCGAPKRQFRNIGPVGSPSGFKENLNYGMGVNRLTPGQKNILIFGSLVLGFIFFMSLYGLK